MLIVFVCRLSGVRVGNCRRQLLLHEVVKWLRKHDGNKCQNVSNMRTLFATHKNV